MTALLRAPAVLLLGFCFSTLHGQESIISKPLSEVESSIPDDISAASPSQPLPEPIDHTVLATRTAHMDVVEGPPMAGLPPVTGTINVTVRLVADPKLPEPPPLLTVLPPDDPAVIAALEELAKNYRGTELLFITATVYGHHRSFLRVYPDGKRGSEVCAWTNLDFNHFTGLGTFRVRQQDETFIDYGLLMGIGNSNSMRWKDVLKQHGLEGIIVEAPELPDLSVAGPAYVVVNGKSESPAMDTLRNLHELYRNAGDRMRISYLARERARKEKLEYFKANPPKPNDVTISFWRRELSQGSGEEKAR